MSRVGWHRERESRTSMRRAGGDTEGDISGPVGGSLPTVVVLGVLSRGWTRRLSCDRYGVQRVDGRAEGTLLRACAHTDHESVLPRESLIRVVPVGEAAASSVSRLRRVEREAVECIGGGVGAQPARGTEQQEADGSMTGECSVCGERFKLEEGISIPRHQRPGRFAKPS